MSGRQQDTCVRSGVTGMWARDERSEVLGKGVS